MSITRRTPLILVAVALVLTAVVHADKFKITWKNPDATPLDFKGKKVAAVVITEQLPLQMSAEEELARELNLRGVEGVAAYRFMPREELQDGEKAKGWFAKNKIVGAVVMRVVSSEKELVYTPTVWATAYYDSFWNYYGTSWTAVHSYSKREDRIITIETVIYDVVKDELIWAGVSEKTNPKSAQQIVRELVAETSTEMRKNGLIAR